MSKKLPTIAEQDETSKTSVRQSKSEKKSQNQLDVIKSLQNNAISKTSQNRIVNGSKTSRTKSSQSGSYKQPSPEPKPSPIFHIKDKNVTLIEDCFGLLYDHNGMLFKVQRYTWKNSSKVQTQIITYGARITSISIPDKKGIVDDIVLGCSDLAGYITYGDYYFGATIGPVTSKVEAAAFLLEGKEYKITCNSGSSCANGGLRGLDRVMWNSYVSGSKVILTYIQPDKHEGFPGPVMYKVSFQLTYNNEFHIEMEAKTSKSTIINLSNLCYFNLGGHYNGPDEIYNHSIQINANCYTLMDEENLPTGKIMNIANTKYDFLKPKLLKNYMNVEPDDGYDQNLCVNRATTQTDCFVARAVHVQNGRMLEMYSNQYGVRFDTANSWGLGLPQMPLSCGGSSLDSSQKSNNDCDIFYLLHKLAEKMARLQVYDLDTFNEVYGLLKEIHRLSRIMQPNGNMRTMSFGHPDYDILTFFGILKESMIQVKEALPKNLDHITDWIELKAVVNELLTKYGQVDDPNNSQFEHIGEHFGEDEWTDNIAEQTSITSKKSIEINENLGQSVDKSPQSTLVKIQSSKQSNHKSQQSVVKNGMSTILKQHSIKSIGNVKSSIVYEKSGMDIVDIQPPKKLANEIPMIYLDGRIHGKGNAIYKRHGGIAFQTQNYPDAIHHSNFPSPILRPGETYTHKIVYKFAIKNKGLSNIRINKRCL